MTSHYRKPMPDKTRERKNGEPNAQWGGAPSTPWESRHQGPPPAGFRKRISPLESIRLGLHSIPETRLTTQWGCGPLGTPPTMPNAGAQATEANAPGRQEPQCRRAIRGAVLLLDAGPQVENYAPHVRPVQCLLVLRPDGPFRILRILFAFTWQKSLARIVPEQALSVK